MAAPTPSARRRILLVEDDDGIRDTVAECLADDYDVAPVSNGADALAWLARERRPDVIILDLVMPVMGGDEFLQRLRALPALGDLPVLLTTAAMPGGGLPSSQADLVLPKPFELDALLGAIETLCRPR